MAGRAGKKCLFEDDVRAMLGMPKVEISSLEDTTLEKKFAHGNQPVTKQMQQRGSNEDVDGNVGLAASLGGRRWMLVVVVLLCVVAAIVVGVELRQAQQSAKRVGVTYQSVTFRGGNSDYHPRRSRERRGRSARGRSDDSGDESRVVTKDNWRALQDTANAAQGQRREMKREDAFRSGGARLGIKAHQVALSLAEKGKGPPAPSSASSAKSQAMETFDKVLKAAAAQDSDKARPSWSESNGGPHKGTQGKFGAGIYSW